MSPSDRGSEVGCPPPTRSERRWFLALCGTFLALTLTYSAVIRLGYGPDEPRHYRFVVLLADQHQLSRILPDGSELGGAISIHPPLYYLILAPFYYPAKALGGAWLAERVLRLLSPIFGLLALWLIWRATRQLFRGRAGLALLSTALVGLWPHFLMDHSVINNDNGSNLAGALFIWFLICRADRRWPVRSALLAGLVVALGALMKAQLLFCLPPALVAVMAWDHGWSFWKQGNFWRAVLLAALPVILLAGPWYARNYLLYGQVNFVPRGYEGIPAGTSLAQAWSSGLVLALGWRAVVGLFQSIWVQVGWIPQALAGPIYTALAIILGLAVAGWVAILLRLRSGRLQLQPGIARDFAAIFLPLALIYPLLIYVSIFVHIGIYQGGRYALFALGGLAAFLAAGWYAALPRPVRLAGAIAVLLLFVFLNAASLWNLVTHLNPTYAPGVTFWTPIVGT